MKKRTFQFPSAMTILLIVILLSTLLTHLIPGGEFVPHTDPVTQEEIVSLEDFHFIDATPVSFLEIPLRIVQAFSSGSTASIVLTYLFMGGGIFILTASGAFQALTSLLIKFLKGNRFLMVAGFTSLFSLITVILSPHAFVAFVPFGIQFARSLGYRPIVGVSMILLGGAVSFSTGALLATTVAAQTLVGLPLYSGAAYRFVCLFVLLIPTILYIYFYAEKTRTESASAPLGSDQADAAMPSDFQEEMHPRHVLTLVIFAVTMGICIYGSITHGWSNMELSAAFLVMGVVIGLLYGNPLDDVFKMYLKGAQSMMGPAVLAGLAGAATSILASSNIIGTIVYFASKLILMTPKVLYAPMMFTMHLIINCFIVSGGGQASATMPIFGPIAQICNIPMQTSVLAFNLGDGLGNYVLPYSNQLVTYIEAGHIPYSQWMRFIWKLFLIWIVLAWILTGISVMVWA